MLEQVSPAVVKKIFLKLFQPSPTNGTNYGLNLRAAWSGQKSVEESFTGEQTGFVVKGRPTLYCLVSVLVTEVEAERCRTVSWRSSSQRWTEWMHCRTSLLSQPPTDQIEWIRSVCQNEISPESVIFRPCGLKVGAALWSHVRVVVVVIPSKTVWSSKVTNMLRQHKRRAPPTVASRHHHHGTVMWQCNANPSPHTWPPSGLIPFLGSI